MIAASETMRFVHATDDLRTAIGARVPEFRSFVRFADIVFTTFVYATDFIHSGRAVGGFFALINEIAFGYAFVQFQGFILILATERDHANVLAFFHAREKRHAVVPLRADVVFGAFENARLVGQS